MRKRVVLFAVILLLGFTFVAHGAEYSERYSRVSLFFLYNSWQEDLLDGPRDTDEEVVGLSVDQCVSKRLSVSVWSTFTRARLDDEYNESALSSLNDTKIGANYTIGNLASVRLAVNVPTGVDALSDNEYIVASAVADNARKFAVRRFGQGLDVSGELYWHPQIGRYELSLGGGYTHKGAYRLLLIDESDYKFGDEYLGKLAASTAGEKFSLGGSVQYGMYTEDEFDSRSVYQSGNSIIIAGRADYNSSINGYAGFSVITRGNAKILGVDSTLTEESLRSGRNEYLGYVGGSIPIGRKIQGLGRLEYKYLTANEYEVGSRRYRPESDYAGLGLGFSYQFSLYFSASAAGNYFIGSTDGEGLDGIGFYTALSFRYW